MMMNMMLTVSC